MNINAIIQILTKYAPSLLLGVRTTMIIALIGTGCGFILGLVVGGIKAIRLDLTSSKAFMDICHKYSSILEPYSIDECFIDLTGTEKIYGDPIKLKQVIMSILVNAAKYTKDGYIEVSANEIVTASSSNLL